MPSNRTNKATSNADFVRRVGVQYTYASRLRNGERLPSMHTLQSIRSAFKLDDSQYISMLDAVARGPEYFGAWANRHLFEESVSRA